MATGPSPQYFSGWLADRDLPLILCLGQHKWDRRGRGRHDDIAAITSTAQCSVVRRSKTRRIVMPHRRRIRARSRLSLHSQHWPRMRLAFAEYSAQERGGGYYAVGLPRMTPY